MSLFANVPSLNPAPDAIQYNDVQVALENEVYELYALLNKSSRVYSILERVEKHRESGILVANEEHFLNELEDFALENMLDSDLDPKVGKNVGLKDKRDTSPTERLLLRIWHFLLDLITKGGRSFLLF